MQIPTRLSIAGFAIVLLSSCGGGAGGDTGTGSSGSGGHIESGAAPVVGAPGDATTSGTEKSMASDGSWLELTPSPLDVATYETESVRFQVEANAHRSFTAVPKVLVLDRSGIIAPTVAIQAVNAHRYIVTMETAA